MALTVWMVQCITRAQRDDHGLRPKPFALTRPGGEAEADGAA